MSRDLKYIVVCYDIHEPRRLQKVAKAMKDFGQRVLKSVFECRLTEGGFEDMKAKAETLIDHQEDSVRYYFLCGKCRKQMKISGLGEPFKTEKQFIIA